MSTINFSSGTTITSTWLNDVDAVVWDVFNGATTVAAATARLNSFVGDSGSGGTKGMVPAPSAGDSGKYLKGDGTWSSNVATLGANTFTGALNTARATVASHATTADIWGAAGNEIDFTGTATVTDFPDAPQAGASRILHCAGACTFTNNANIAVQGAANYTAAAGDIVTIHAITASTFRIEIEKADGTAVVGGGGIAQEFRLTLTSGTPVTTSDVSGATTIYCTPYKGNKISLYSGSAWVTRTSAEFSLALGTLTSGKPYDVFCYDNGGTPTLEFLVWTDDTTRATALAYQDGVLVKSGAATRRYLGTFYTTSTTQTEDSATSRYLYNYYHRKLRRMVRNEAAASWTYTTAAYRQANASASNQLNYLQGVAEDAVMATVACMAVNSSGPVVSGGIGLDSTTANSASLNAQVAATTNGMPLQAHYRGTPVAGRHYLAWLEYSGASGTTTWYGTSGEIKSGIIGEIYA